jgi:hypothetical protein
MPQHDQKPAPIGPDAPKTPADRVRQIQELQRAAEASQVQPLQGQPLAAPVAAPLAARVGDAFAVQALNPVREALAAKTSPTEASAYARAQKSAHALFGSPSDLEVIGNPWKVIPFGDSLPALFDVSKDSAPLVPEKAVQTEHGALFEVGLASKNPEAGVQKRAVLVGADGKLAGAECRTTADVSRLFSNAQWLLPKNASGQDARWQVSAGNDATFALTIERASGKGRTTETLPIDNFGRVATQGKRSDVVVANYFLDRFDAGVR